MKQPVSVCMIARNEEANLEACLRSVLGYVEEVVVVDTGSTDRTPDIARALGANVYEFAWCDDFAKARNFALSQATQPFVLVLDADERLLPESLPHLAAFCRQDARVAGRVKILSLSGEGEQVSVSEITRLFPNRPGFQYAGRIHEQLQYEGSAPAACSTDVAVLHIGYTAQTVQTGRKIERNLRLLHMELEERPDDLYVMYQIGKTHYVGKQYEEAVAAFAQVIERVGATGHGPAWLSTVLLQMAYSHLNLKQFPALFETVSIGVELYPDFTDLYFVYGLALIQQGDARQLDDIRETFEHCLRLGEPDPQRYETVVGVGSFLAQYNLGVYHEVIGQHPQAKLQYQAAAEQGYETARQRLAQLG